MTQFEGCPYIIRKRAGDESYDICELNTKSCLIEHGHYTCETWEGIKREEANSEGSLKSYEG